AIGQAQEQKQIALHDVGRVAFQLVAMAVMNEAIDIVERHTRRPYSDRSRKKSENRTQLVQRQTIDAIGWRIDTDWNGYGTGAANVGDLLTRIAPDTAMLWRKGADDKLQARFHR